jgi:trehalose 6-phosphate phosphatase
MPIPISFTTAAILRGVDLVERLAGNPTHTALLLDVDGTLAPIVPRPQDARVPEATRTELERLHGRYALVACVSGRTAEDAQRVVGVPGLEYVGVHGLELDPEAKRWRRPLREVLAAAGWPAEETDDKGVTLSFHYRREQDESAARVRLEEVAARARAAGLVPRFGRKVLEVRPPVDADKGTAVRHLLSGRELASALYAGDDTTDLDAFRGLAQAELELVVRVAVVSDEAPAELREKADLTVEGPEGLARLLGEL